MSLSKPPCPRKIGLDGKGPAGSVENGDTARSPQGFCPLELSLCAEIANQVEL